jgi:SAM-dependent methyltransferase
MPSSPPIQLRSRFAAIALAFALAGASDLTAADPPFLGPPGKPPSAFPKADRPVAAIVSPIWHTEQERDAADETGQLVRLIGIKPGMTIADIGAGSGYNTVRLAPVVGPKGRIIAQDITPKYLADLAKRVRDLKLDNVTIGLGAPHDPRLPPASADVALLVHMYHEVETPYAFLSNLAPALKPGARIAIVDSDKSTSNHGTPPKLLRCELEAVGYRQITVQTLKTLDAYLAVFDLPSGQNVKRPQDIKACRQ